MPASSIAARIFDVVVAAAILGFFTPLMILIAAVVFAESGRPIFFSQVRLGRRGQHFHLHKFRKFNQGGCSSGRPLTMEDDPRLSVTGRFLARTKLDELPQLWNVIKGDMAIVGPRPESLDFQDCFDGASRRVLQHKPGIFGPSQVLFRNERFLYRGRADPERFYRDVLFPLKAEIDLVYFTHRTFSRDVAWAVRGALAVFGWLSLLHSGARLVEEAERCIRGDRAGGYGLSAQIGLLTGVGHAGAAEIARGGGSEIAGA